MANRFNTFKTCFVSNSAIPEFVDNSFTLIYFLLGGQSQELGCEAVGVPTPTYAWTDLQSSEKLSWLTPNITINFSQSAEYMCNASNWHGSVSRVYSLIRAGIRYLIACYEYKLTYGR